MICTRNIVDTCVDKCVCDHTRLMTKTEAAFLYFER